MEQVYKTTNYILFLTGKLLLEKLAHKRLLIPLDYKQIYLLENPLILKI